MRPPLILVDRTGDIEIFDTAAELEQYAEPADVLQDEYVAYDSEGRLLRLQVVQVVRGRFLKVCLPVVRVVEAEQEPAHQDDLKAALCRFLAQLGYTDAEGEQQSLSNLLSLVVRAIRVRNEA